MNISVTPVSDTRKTITAECPQAFVLEMRKAFLANLAAKVSLPGFRPGKAPESLLIKRFGDDLIQDLKSTIIRKAIEEIQKKSDLAIYGSIEIDIKEKDFDGKSACTVVWTVDVEPAWELPEYSNIKLDSEINEASKEDIQKALEKIRNQHAQFDKVEEKAQKGDYVKLSYEGKFADGTPLETLALKKRVYSKQENTWEEAGADEPLGVPAIIEALVGMTAGTEATIEATFPDEHEVAALAGKKVLYTVRIHEVYRKTLPELTPGFIKETLKYEDENELQEALKKEFLQQRKGEAVGAAFEKIERFLEENTKGAAPQLAIEDARLALSRQASIFGQMSGYDQAQFAQQEAAIVEQIKREAPRFAKRQLLLKAIARKENIELEQKDMERPLMSEAMKTRQNPTNFINRLKKDPQYVEEIRNQALCHKVLDFIYKKCNKSSAQDH